MDSSTLPFSRVPRLALGLLLIALVALGTSAVYTLRLNPELAFFKHAFVIKQAWQAELRKQYGTNIVFCGGSSCFTGIDAKHMRDRYSLPVVNLGFGAGMGPGILGRMAFEKVKSGDTLILAFEPGLLAGNFETPALGTQFAISTTGLKSLREVEPTKLASSLLALRPGGYHAFTLFGKLILRKPLYRYSHAEVREGGWHAVADRREVSPLMPEEFRLSDDAKRFLADTAAWCATNNVRLACTLPWMYYSPEHASEARSRTREFLAELNLYMPVLKDPYAGCYTVREEFADSTLHLIPESATKHSDEVARELLAWDVYEKGTLNKSALPGP